MDNRFNGPYTFMLGVYAPKKETMQQGVMYLNTIDPEKTSNKDGQGVHFFCPCGCGQLVYLPVRYGEQNGHAWGYTVSGEIKLSITPSILERYGCKSHYYITNGMVQWC